MTISYKEFLALTEAEVCGDRLIVGIGPTRRYVGDIAGGKFNLTEDGEALMEQLEKGKKGAAAVSAAAAATAAAKKAAKDAAKASPED